MLSRKDVVGWLVVLAAAGFTIWQLHPGLLLSSSTPTGGDMGSHVWGPWYMKEHLLPQGQITGWTDDWWGGFPAYRFYFPLPSVVIALLSFVLPYGVAFKLVAVSGVVSLPLTAYLFGRLSGLRQPGPAILSAGALLYLFDTSFTIYGGNIASTLAGEYSFSIALSLSLLFLGVVARGLDTGRHRLAAAVLLLATGLTHLLPTLFAVGAALVLLALRFSRRRLWWLITVGVASALLIAFWALPFVVRLPFANDLGWVKVTDYLEILFPEHLRWLLVPAGLGLIAAVGLRVRTALAIAAIGLVAAVGVVLMPEARLWNARFLPFWYLAVYLLAAVGVAELLRALSGAFTAEGRPPSKIGLGAAPLLVMAIVIAFLGGEVGAFAQLIPGGHQGANFLPQWSRWNFEGYEGKAAWPEYSALMTTMGELPCGRAMWEHNSELNNAYGSAMALMLLPFWTDGCIDSMEGLFFESSATVPYHFLTQYEMSRNPSGAQRGLPYAGPDATLGTDHLRLLGVDYYLARTPEMIALADAAPGLRPLTTSGPWHIYRVSGSQLIEPLQRMPVVLEGVGDGQEWTDAIVPWFMDQQRWDEPLAADGPASWPRTDVADAASVTSPTVPTTTISDVETRENTISFRVARPGTPIVIHESYFPNWKASGADGPWRISPNEMVVVPTDTTVTLTYGTTPVEVAALLLSILGVLMTATVLRRPLRLDDHAAAAPTGESGATLLRRVGATAAVATLVDVLVVIALSGAGDVRPALGDAIAVAAAALTAMVLRRSLPREDPAQRLLARPSRYLPITAAAGVLDVVVFVAVLGAVDGSGAPAVLTAKMLALGVAGSLRFLVYRDRLRKAVHEDSAILTPRPLPPGDALLSVVIPTFEEQDRIAATIQTIRDELRAVEAEGGLEIVVVDDGSSDGTASVARAAGADLVEVHPTNRGKGAAVRTGMLRAHGQTIAFLDADLAYAPGQLRRFVDELAAGHDVVIGSRHHVATRTLVRAGRLREITGRIFNLITWFTLLGGYRDTQSGIKAFRGDAARLLASTTRIDGFAFDVELLHLTERYHLSLGEVPVEIVNSERSTVHVVRDALRMARDIVRIRWWASSGAYDRPDASAGWLEGGREASE